MPSKSKTKGSTFERDVAKKLNEVFDTNEFSRTFGSGAFVGKTNWNKRAGLSHDVKTALAGDIIVPSWFPFNIECKNYEDSPIYHNLLNEGGDKTLDKWLGKSIHDAVNTRTLPCVIFKTTRKGAYVALPESLKSMLEGLPNYAKYKGFYLISYDFFMVKIIEIIAAHKVSELVFNVNETTLYQSLLNLFSTENNEN